MIKEILFASNNQHKVSEIKKLLPDHYRLISLNDIQWKDEIPEPFDTYEANAKAKAYFIFDRTGISCFADDSGLAIDALDGRPGVHSAHYAGVSRSSEANIEKVLNEMRGIENRKARFHAIIAFIPRDGLSQLFTGEVEGRITNAPAGNGGFGYDPIFVPDGFDLTFGELSESIKNQISHRSKAMQKFIAFLQMNAHINY